MSEHYDFDAVKGAVSVEDYLASQGIAVRGGRANAVWRGGSRFSVAVSADKWHDFAADEGGSVLDLAMRVEGFADLSTAADALGARYGVMNGTASVQPKPAAREWKAAEPPKTSSAPKVSRGVYLAREGFTNTATYTYTDEQGAPLYVVERWEKTEDGEKRKEFVQHVPGGTSLGDVRRVLYNLPAVAKAQTVYLVEGEKDCETLAKLGLVATTNSGGAKFWRDEFCALLAGKDVVIIADNDDVGKERGTKLHERLSAVARSVRLAVVSELPKGDVTDYLEKEGGTVAGLMERIAAYPQPERTDPEKEKAKKANETPFANFHEERHGRQTIIDPIQINELRTECMTRFLGYPRKLGETLFDFSPDTRDIVELRTDNDLFAWIARISGHNVNWRKGDGMITRQEFFAMLSQTAQRYSGIYSAPHYPLRKDAFYTYKPMPKPTPNHSAFWGFVDFFSLADEASRLLLAAFFAAPMYYEPDADRPAWIIDTDDAQGSGKTTTVKMNAALYGETPFELDFETLDKDQSQVKKRLISTEGRTKRIALFDNVEKTLKSPVLASLITAKDITERAAYGRGEESRPNDLTFVATINGASVDTDMATRSYTLRVKKPEVMRPSWKRDVLAYIEQNRLAIYADIMDMLATAKYRERKASRFGQFDAVVLSAVCRTDEEWDMVDQYITVESAKSNEDADRATEFVELLENALHNPTEPGAESVDFALPIVIRMTDVDEILRRSSGALRNWTSKKVRQLIKGGFIPECARNFEQLNRHHEGFRHRSIFYGVDKQSECYGDLTEFQVVHFSGGNTPKVVHRGTMAKVN